jgi:hypothetical protein
MRIDSTARADSTAERVTSAQLAATVEVTMQPHSQGYAVAIATGTGAAHART